MPFGILNRTRTFGLAISQGLIQFTVGFTEEVVFNITAPHSAGAQTIEDMNLPSPDGGNKLVSHVGLGIVTALKSEPVRKQIFNIVAAASPTMLV